MQKLIGRKETYFRQMKPRYRGKDYYGNSVYYGGQMIVEEIFHSNLLSNVSKATGWNKTWQGKKTDNSIFIMIHIFAS